MVPSGRDSQGRSEYHRNRNCPLLQLIQDHNVVYNRNCTDNHEHKETLEQGFFTFVTQRKRRLSRIKPKLQNAAFKRDKTEWIICGRTLHLDKLKPTQKTASNISNSNTMLVSWDITSGMSTHLQKREGGPNTGNLRCALEPRHLKNSRCNYSVSALLLHLLSNPVTSFRGRKTLIALNAGWSKFGINIDSNLKEKRTSRSYTSISITHRFKTRK